LRRRGIDGGGLKRGEDVVEMRHRAGLLQDRAGQAAKVAQGILPTNRRSPKVVGAAPTDRAPLRPAEGLAGVDEAPEGGVVPVRELVDNPRRRRRPSERFHLTGAIALLGGGQLGGQAVARRDELTERERVELVHRIGHRTTLASPDVARVLPRRSDAESRPYAMRRACRRGLTWGPMRSARRCATSDG